VYTIVDWYLYDLILKENGCVEPVAFGSHAVAEALAQEPEYI